MNFEEFLALRDEIAQLCRSDPPGAEARAERLAQEEVPEEARPLALRARANAAHANERYDAARDLYREAASVHRDRGEEVESARCLRSLVDVLALRGQVEEALAAGEEAREILGHATEPMLLAQLDVNLGNVHVRRNDCTQARAHYLRARVVFDETGEDGALAFTNYNLGVVETNADRLDEAERYLGEAREGLEELGAQVHMADCDYALAWLASRRGRFAEAIEGLERARETYTDRAQKPSGPPLCDLDLAEIYLRLDARWDAAKHAQRAEEGFAEIGLELEREAARLLLAVALARAGEVPQAVRRLAASAKRFRELSNEPMAALCEARRAEIESRAGRHGPALARLTRARQELSGRGLKLAEDLVSCTLARARLAAGEAEVAADLLEELLERGCGLPAFDLLVQAEAGALLAEARIALGDEDGAIEALRASLDATERGYDALPSTDVRVAFLRERHEAWPHLAWRIAERGESREALLLLERGRARGLREGRRAGGSPSTEEQELRERLDWLLARRLDSELGPVTGEHELRGRAPDDQAIRDTHTELRKLARAGGGSGSAGTLDPEVIETARGDDVLVAYMTHGGRLRALVVDQHGTHDVPLPASTDQITGDRDLLSLQVEKRRLGAHYRRRHAQALEGSVRATLDRLGAALIEPMLDRIEGRGVVILPCGPLHELPFCAFGARGAPLIDRAEISIAPSLAHIARTRSSDEPAAGPTLHACGADGNGLGAVKGEMEDLEGLYGSALQRVEPSALPTALAEGGIRGSLHIAGHGSFHAREPMLSALALGDRFLLAHDLERLRLDLDLVTLAGCETGRRRRLGGEEFAGLSRAFLAAGARACLGTLWAVEDGEARDLVFRFYSELAAGETARTALSRAQRSLWLERGSLSSWAAFTLAGAPDVRLPAPASRVTV